MRANVSHNSTRHCFYYSYSPLLCFLQGVLFLQMSAFLPLQQYGTLEGAAQDLHVGWTVLECVCEQVMGAESVKECMPFRLGFLSFIWVSMISFERPSQPGYGQ